MANGVLSVQTKKWVMAILLRTPTKLSPQNGIPKKIKSLLKKLRLVQIKRPGGFVRKGMSGRLTLHREIAAMAVPIAQTDWQVMAIH